MADIANIVDPKSIFGKFKLGTEQDALFDVPKFDEEGGRAKLKERLDRAAGQLDNSRGKQGGVDYETGHHDIVRFKPTLNGHRVFIESVDEPYFPVSSKTFPDFIAELKKLVDAGHYDDQIKAALENAPTTSKRKAKGTSGTRRASSAKSGDKPWAVREGYAGLSVSEKQTITANYRNGLNPDRTVIADAGHKPDAPIVGNPKKKKA